MPPTPETILLVDDDVPVQESTTRLLEQRDLGRCLAVGTGAQALEAVSQESIAVVLLDLGLPDLAGEEVLDRIRRSRPDLPVIIITAQSSIDTAVRCMAAGAYDYVVKGDDPERLMNSTARALEFQRKGREIAALRERMLAADLRRPEAFADLITASERMRVLFRFIEAVAPSTEPILLFGETGTGKELFAQAVHRASGTKGPFVATNLGGLDDQMVADTLFGHSKGAFTGADQARKGLVFTAAEGTLFLDEIGDLSPASQVKLLRFLENREYYPLGSDVVRRSSARVVAATNRDLETLAAEGKFRQDLIYRLSVFRIDVPPLRERPEDIPLLSQHFLDTLGAGSTLSSGAMAFLRSYGFPGNVRELRGLLLRAMAVSPGKIIDRPALEGLLKSHPNLPQVRSAPPSSFPTIRQAIDELVAEAMARTSGHQAQAALLLGITPQALSKRLRRRGSSPEV